MSDLLSRHFCKTKKGPEFGIGCVFSVESVSQLKLTKNGAQPLELGENEAKWPVEASGAGLSGVLKSNHGAPPKSSSSNG